MGKRRREEKVSSGEGERGGREKEEAERLGRRVNEEAGTNR